MVYLSWLIYSSPPPPCRYIFNAGYMMMRMPTFYMDPKKSSEAASGSLVFCWIGIQQVVIGLYDKWHNSENAIHAVSFNMFNSYSCISPMRHSMISPYSNDFCVGFIHSTQRRAPESSATPGHLQQCATGEQWLALGDWGNPFWWWLLQLGNDQLTQLVILTDLHEILHLSIHPLT